MKKKRIRKKTNEKIKQHVPQRRIITKIIFITFFLFILSLIVSMLSVILLIPSIDAIKDENVILGAHRGNAIDYIENTIEAFQSALDEPRYKFIEFDVQYTKDKIPIIYHDQGLIRLHRKSYNVKDLTYAQLQNITRFHIPTYEEVMELIAGKKPLDIELKSQGNFTDDKILVQYIVEDCKRRNIMNTTIFSSVSKEVVIEFKNQYPKIKTGKIYYTIESSFFGTEFLTSKLYQEIEEMDADFVMLHGANIRNYRQLKENLPEEKILVIWYFTDEMYILDSNLNFDSSVSALKPNLFRWINEKFVKPKEKCLWWC
ncbi:hypothetical protein GOV14_06355 [Candidatus Pacearchaeota archaeon]|nr:hypothetical protein [Candidatus Pacearchaeota archaeon]